MKLIVRTNKENTTKIMNKNFTGIAADGGGAGGYNTPDQFEFFAINGVKQESGETIEIRLPDENEELGRVWPSHTFSIKILDEDSYILTYNGRRHGDEILIREMCELGDIIFYETNGPKGLEPFETFDQYASRVGALPALEAAYQASPETYMRDFAGTETSEILMKEAAASMSGDRELKESKNHLFDDPRILWEEEINSFAEWLEKKPRGAKRAALYGMLKYLDTRKFVIDEFVDMMEKNISGWIQTAISSHPKEMAKIIHEREEETELEKIFSTDQMDFINKKPMDKEKLEEVIKKLLYLITTEDEAKKLSPRILKSYMRYNEKETIPSNWWAWNATRALKWWMGV